MISVIMAAYNSSKYIGLAIESILNQTFSDFELIVVDDHSTDKTLEIAKHYAEQDSRVRVIQTECNSGANAARNLAVQHAGYPWLAIMDSDDVSHSTRFEKQLNAAIANPNVVMWGGYAQHISSSGKVLSLIQQGVKTEEEFYTLRTKGHIPFVVHPTSFIKKDIFLKVGGYAATIESYPITAGGDFELTDRIANHGPVLVVPEPLLLYRIHSESLSMQKFFWQKTVARYVYARHRARIKGEEEPMLSSFIREYNSQPLTSKLPRQIQTMGQFWYRKAGLLYAEHHHFKAIFYLIMSILSNPFYSLPRLWQQKIAPKIQSSGENLVCEEV